MISGQKAIRAAKDLRETSDHRDRLDRLALSALSVPRAISDRRDPEVFRDQPVRPVLQVPWDRRA